MTTYEQDVQFDRLYKSQVLAEALRNFTGGYTFARASRISHALSALDIDALNRAHIEECADERTGRRYGNAACRKDRCVKIGSGGRNRGQKHAYQLWLVWA